MAETISERLQRLDALKQEFPMTEERMQSLSDEERKYCAAREKDWETITAVSELRYEVMQAIISSKGNVRYAEAESA